MSRKFEKNRSVDRSYMAVPVKYCLGVNSKNQNCYDNSDSIKVSYAIKQLKKNNFSEELFNDVYCLSDIFQNSYDCGMTEGEYELFEKILNDAENITSDKKEKDKDFVIIDFYGNKALCAWRNNSECKIGMTFMCPIIKKNKKSYLKYKNQLIPLNDKSGWVI